MFALFSYSFIYPALSRQIPVFIHNKHCSTDFILSDPSLCVYTRYNCLLPKDTFPIYTKIFLSYFHFFLNISTTNILHKTFPTKNVHQMFYSMKCQIQNIIRYPLLKHMFKLNGIYRLSQMPKIHKDTLLRIRNLAIAPYATILSIFILLPIVPTSI